MCRVLRYARRQLGMTRQQVAEACGMSARRYAMTERGQYEPDAEEMRRICETLRVTVR
jgi:transcriptional regulator with XRE-family HTH domain